LAEAGSEGLIFGHGSRVKQQVQIAISPQLFDYPRRLAIVPHRMGLVLIRGQDFRGLICHQQATQQ